MSLNGRDRLLAACYRFMLPVAKFLLNAGISYREFDELAKRAFVDIATSEYGLRGRETSYSRISVMTGLGRKEVARLRQAPLRKGNDARELLSPLADLITRWSTDQAWMDDDNQPRILELEGREKSFARLVALTVGDRPIVAVQRELERLGAIRVNDCSEVELLRPNLVPTLNDEKLISALSYSLRSLAATVARNCGPAGLSESPWVERFVESQEVHTSDIPELRAQVSARLIGFTREIEKLFAEASAEPTTDGTRIGIGVFYSE